MKQLITAAAALALSFSSVAEVGQEGASGFGGLTTATLTAMGVSAAVAAAIISNSKGVTLTPGQEFDLVCNDPTEGPVAGVCTTSTSTVVVTGTGTNTSTTTVPVVSTYPAIVVPRP